MGRDAGRGQFSRVEHWRELAVLGLAISCSGKTSNVDSKHGFPGRDAGLAPIAADAAADAPTDSGVCPRSCKVVTGVMKDPIRGCFDRSRSAAVGCDCEETSFATPGCHKRVSDGSIWVFAASQPDPSAWTDCTVDSYSPKGLYACDFENCARPPQSTCDVSATCKEKRCDSLEYDTQGCQRASCSSDGDCASDEVCVAISCVDGSSCLGFDDSCGCFDPLVCVNGSRCNAAALYGPRGAWQELVITKSTGPCPPGSTCTTTYTLTPDGQISKNGINIPTTYSPNQIATLVNGPLLRPALRNGTACGPSPADLSIRMELRLSTTTLSRDVTGCAVSDAQDNPFAQAYQFVQNL